MNTIISFVKYQHLLAWLVLQIGMPFLIWAARGKLLKEQP